MKQIFSIIILVMTVSVHAKQDLIQIPPAYKAVAEQFNVPAKVLYAIARQESKPPSLNHPWPWAANVRGKSYFFNTREELTAFLKEKIRNRETAFDVGLMQINWPSHGHRFKSLEDVIDPMTNLRAGADYLRYLINRTGSTDAAIGMYHTGPNGPKKRQEHYKSLVYAHLRLTKE